MHTRLATRDATAATSRCIHDLLHVMPPWLHMGKKTKEHTTALSLRGSVGEYSSTSNTYISYSTVVKLTVVISKQYLSFRLIHSWFRSWDTSVRSIPSTRDFRRHHTNNRRTDRTTKYINKRRQDTQHQKQYNSTKQSIDISDKQVEYQLC